MMNRDEVRTLEFIDNVAREQEPPPGDPGPGPKGPVRTEEFAMIGVADVLALSTPPYQRVLDNLAASPGAVRYVRVQGSFKDVWSKANASDPTAIDFSALFKAYREIESRGMTPFVVLGPFPEAVSSAPTTPPADLSQWKLLLAKFFDDIVAAFGERAVSRWLFEVWSEPNVAGSWGGSFDQYKGLYEATSEVAVASGHPLRLGGPAILWDVSVMDDFLGFVSSHPTIRCDFLSYHAGGARTRGGKEDPSIVRVYQAAQSVAIEALKIDAKRFQGVSIINSEATLVDFGPLGDASLMDKDFPTWLTSLAIAHDALSSEFAPSGFRFFVSSDCLAVTERVQAAPYDGQRSLMTRTSRRLDPRLDVDLFKVPVMNFYELLRLFGEQHGTIVSGASNYFPNGDVFHAITVSPDHITSIFTNFPRDPRRAAKVSLNYTIEGISWPVVNSAGFSFDRTHSNGFQVLGGTSPLPTDPNAADCHRIRLGQELGGQLYLPARPMGGKLTFLRELAPYETLVFWLTPELPALAPATPAWIEVTEEPGSAGNNVLLRWTPNTEPFFFTYIVERVSDTPNAPGVIITPNPLRAALWVDTGVAPGRYRYRVYAQSAYLALSPPAISPLIKV
ncbi:GH39 family glycosyl hydrolase [Sorangium sp. So ce388]|uniref:GH39 family glycosyl hydrolase n=1 Tax=Sorangium sp. So ce388 TaxID=3133309 RepID=UPI003F5B0E91